MTRTELLSITKGQLGLYEWDPELPCVEVDEVHEVLVGPRRGKLFRRVAVASATGNATISFHVRED